MKKTEKTVEELYGDILEMPHPVSKKHPQMSMIDRGAQFAPFAALTGYGEAVDEQARLHEEEVLFRERGEEAEESI
ncbi:MAG: hypothetical protein J5935_03700 [Lachnospiraceae bacterium]|nr:hypothetical protein [Lachnospiraceae bacterium]